MNGLEIDNLRYAYADGTVALQGVNLAVGAGECLGLIGPNGAGKSSLLLAMLGFLRGQGRVTVDGVTLAAGTVREVRRRAGLVFQESDDQLFMPTVFDDVAFGPLCQGLAEEEVRRRVAEALAAVGATELGPRAPYHLSGGEKRRVALAGVLAMRPAVVLFDEPSSNLDPAARRQLIKLMAGLPATRLVATHDLDLVLEVCGRVAIMFRGAIVAEGPPERLLSDAGLMARYNLEVPGRLQPRT